MQQINVRIVVLQEMKLTGGIQIHSSAVYNAWSTEAERLHRGEVVIIWREEAGWKIEGDTEYRPNMVSFKIMASWKKWSFVGVYVPPNDQMMVHWVEQALACCRVRTETMVVVNPKPHLVQPRNRRKEDLAIAVANRGLEEQKLHLIPCQCYRGGGGGGGHGICVGEGVP